MRRRRAASVLKRLLGLYHSVVSRASLKVTSLCSVELVLMDAD